MMKSTKRTYTEAPALTVVTIAAEKGYIASGPDLLLLGHSSTHTNGIENYSTASGSSKDGSGFFD